MTPAQNRSLMLHAGTFVSGIFAAVTVMASSSVDIYSAYDHAVTGVRELMAAWAIIGPVLFAGWAAYKASTKQKLLDVVSAPDATDAAREIQPDPKVLAVADELKKS